MYTLSDISKAVNGNLHLSEKGDPEINNLLIDSRRLISPENCLFIALVSERNNGHRYIGELYEKGVRNFLVSEPLKTTDTNYINKFPEASFIQTRDSLVALQELATWHRLHFQSPILGVTGSNGKTIVKEWLYQLLGSDFKVIRSPKSYNSQVGVPLSVWKMDSAHDLGIFEAGISKPGEMERLEAVIRPTIGIITNVGAAHDEHFTDQKRKVEEKLKPFQNSSFLIYCSDYPLISDFLKEDKDFQNLKTFTWSRKKKSDLQITRVEKTARVTRIWADFHSELISIKIPFTDEASIENAIHCWAFLLNLNKLGIIRKDTPTKLVTLSHSLIAKRMLALTPIAMRLELKEGINHCSIINDCYNSDINSLGIALDFLSQQNQHKKKTIILSDILQSGQNKEDLYNEIAGQIAFKKIDRIIGIGRDISRYADKFQMAKLFYENTDDFLSHFPVSSFQNETILLKGARHFEFEKLSNLLQQKSHETVMEINIDALVHNLNYYRSKLRPGTKTMAMVKAFSYGSGSFEIANVLQFHHVDYLAVAYADEGVELRKAGIRLPIMVMSPEEQSLDTLLKFNMEPEIYNLRILNLLNEAIERNHTSIQEEVRIHIKLDTGMHRLGFVEKDIKELITFLTGKPNFHVQSIFSHLAASEDPTEDEFSREQIAKFNEMSKMITHNIPYPVLLHILNSAGVSRFPEAQMDMVRLGIGLYGIGSSKEEQTRLRNVSTLKSAITQIKRIQAGDTIGYNRQGKAIDDMVVAVVAIGYADGLNRRLGNGIGALYVHRQPAPVIGNVCMDLTMIDITGIEITGIKTCIKEGDEVIIFGDDHPIGELAGKIGTIPYEVLTSISRRVKRIYFHE